MNANREGADPDSFDAIVIGTGFGGAVVACRLAQRDKRICVLERGRRYESQSPVEYQGPHSSGTDSNGKPQWSDFPKLPGEHCVLPDPRRWSWPQEQGLWDVSNLGDIATAQAAGYGGGSLVYANVHLRAPDEVFEEWPFDRQELDPYYNLAAYMFDIKPITEAPFEEPALPTKTGQLQEVANELEREDDFFYPPLAINYSVGRNRFNRVQGACDGCGECCTGCRYRAKNSLDLNYLAIVDDSPKAKVWTQAEATLITAEHQGRYKVNYLDHLRGGKPSEVWAKQVFVCAGAVHSTELLLKSHAAKTLPNLNKALGSKYFPNADAIGMVYDATTPDGEPRSLSPTDGPTITASIYSERPGNGSQKPSWFLLEEGGFPAALARHIGLLRSPTLLRRNRYDDRNSCKIQPVKGTPSSSLTAAAAERQSEPLRSAAAAMYRLLWDDPRVFEEIVPKSLRDACKQLEDELDPFLDRQLRSFVPKVKWQLLGPIGWLLPTTLIVWATKRVLRRKYGLGSGADPKVRLERASQIVQWLAKFDDTGGCHSQNLMVLLVMGRDAEPGRFLLKRRSSNGKPSDKETAEELSPENLVRDVLDNLSLKVDMTDAPKPIYTRQENLMRDVACALGGKLRVNPLWSYARTPVTVHSQGGCPMATNGNDGVTSEWGEVDGHPGLFVMDAAAFPAPVGVNPAATIVAVAERNMANLLGEPTEEMREANKWWEQRSWKDTEKVRFEPPQNGPSVTPKNHPVSIEWKEKMSGFHYLTQKPGDDTEYEIAEAKGREEQNLVSVELTATVKDVAAVIRSKDHAVQMKGDATVTWPNPPAQAQTMKLEVGGTLKLPDGRHPVPQEGRKMWLELRSECGEFELVGYKRLRNDPGPDAWRDTSTLFLTLKNLNTAKESYGVIRLSLDEFLFQQVPTFNVLNTEDPARTAWALTSFSAYFFGVLQGVYLPQLDEAVAQFTKWEVR